jgi:hypothetical protein
MTTITDLDSVTLYHAARHARARAIGAALTRLAAAGAALLIRVAAGCRRRLRLREIVEA